MILKSDIEKDARNIIESLQGDYVIPTSSQIITPIIKPMSIIYFMHLLAYAANDFFYNEVRIDFLGQTTYFFISCGILTLMALIMTYGNLSILMCIPKDVRDSSLLLNLLRDKMKFYGCVMIAINIVVAVVMINIGPGFIVFYGFSWFASILIGGVILSMSMSRYMTPAVVATLDKIREVVSSEAKGK
ncbi:hypothetical protein RZR41_24560 [Raoultella ornithinolytica]|uniref:hypothetical protein n=1 Tax=Raoultella ornithinolytica TaxID=54291 RepID=UPI00292C3D9F|nr:hypothetical protein [Raoultella ornithinolytica]MDV1123185.1 hypothetical protein [Raoultella ornithinolytica]MDV1893545.1 hypothetical protein [Raoultella ornithinolytica]